MVEALPAVIKAIRNGYSGAVIVIAAFSLPATRDNLEGPLADGPADLLAVDRAFLANPDLVRAPAQRRRQPCRRDHPLQRQLAGYINYPAPGEAA